MRIKSTRVDKKGRVCASYIQASTPWFLRPKCLITLLIMWLFAPHVDLTNFKLKKVQVLSYSQDRVQLIHLSLDSATSQPLWLNNHKSLTLNASHVRYTNWWRNDEETLKSRLLHCGLGNFQMVKEFIISQKSTELPSGLFPFNLYHFCHDKE